MLPKPQRRTNYGGVGVDICAILSSMRPIEVINIFAILLSPVIALLISKWLDTRKEKRNQRLSILSTIIANRHTPTSQDAVKAMNLIDIAFYKDAKVRTLWKEYFGMLSNEGLDNEMGWKQRREKNLELIHAMAKNLGYGEAINHLDVDRIYYPQGLVSQEATGRELATELLRVLKGTQSLSAVPCKEKPSEK